MRDLKGKTALITGSASGIGFGMAQAFVESGMNLVMTDIDEVRLKSRADQLARQGAQILAVPLDVTERPAWEKAAQSAESRFGKIHVLCNNAGIVAMGWA